MYQFGVILSLVFFCLPILAKSGPFLIDKYDINKIGRNNLEKSNDGFLCDNDIGDFHLEISSINPMTRYKSSALIG